MPDILQPCLIESANTRLSIVQMEQSWANVLARHEYPLHVAEQLGQMLASSILLRSKLKQGSSIILQIQGDGPIQTLVAQSNPKNTLRGLAKWQQDLNFNPSSSLEEIYGNARLVMTLVNSKQRYQGIIELSGQRLSDSLEKYFSQSEQLPSSLQLFANKNRVAGLLIQKMPDDRELNQESEDWNRINLLTQTVSAEELLNLPAIEVIQRLYHQEDVRVYKQQNVYFNCSCSRQRIDTVLETMGRDSVFELLEEQGMITVDCEFCNQTYHYDQQQVEQLFVNHVADEPVSIN